MISEFITKNELPKYRAQQFNQMFYQNNINSFDEITSWPLYLREKLKEEILFSTLEEVKCLISEDKMTVKVLFRIKRTSKMIETVLIRHDDGRNTVCVSCMVGCPVKCSFCATGKMVFGGNLTPTEIVDQVMHFKRLLSKTDNRVSNIVFMGMGEPTLMLDEIMKSVEIFNDPDKIGISSRRITIPTSGHIREMEKLLEMNFKGRLAVSLHAPNQELRASLMPVAIGNKLEDLMKTIDKFEISENRRISYEYILLKDVNDTEEHAEQLASLLRGRFAHVNLIPYNPVPGETFERPSKNRVHAFSRILTDRGIQNTFRVTMGDDIKAACGQLAGEVVASAQPE